jgi:hypothetical protein
MADDRLTPSETAMLLLLMAEAREISNPELNERYGVTLTGKSHKRLVDLKLVESRKGQRNAFFLQLSEQGWARCNEGFAVGDVRPRAAGQALTAVMGGLQRYLTAKGLKMVHVFAPGTVAEPVAAPVAEPVAAPPPTASGNVETGIRNAYRKLAKAPGGWVSLADLRPMLGGFNRAQVDRALVAMIEESTDVNLVPESNQKALTPAQREAAVRIGDQNKHLISIGAS